VHEVLELGKPRERRPETVLALIAHDAKKDDLLRLVRAHRRTFVSFRLVATGTTGKLLGDELGLPIERMATGPEGGDLQIGARIVEGRVDAVIFLRDPLTAHPHEPDIQAFLKVCDVHRVPVATNVASAEILLHFLAEHERRVAEAR
jgi:methylglyoxal synthase